MDNTKRLFAAVKIHPSDGFLNIYNQIKSDLRRERITWVNPANMHLTIKFFGETYIQQIPDIGRCLTNAATRLAPFELQVKNTGMFGSKYDPRVIWFGIEDGGNLQRLFAEVNKELESINIFPDRQNFVPHLTIGRIKELRDKNAFQQVLEKFREHNSGKQMMDELVLYESILRREGPEYIPLHKFRFP